LELSNQIVIEKAKELGFDLIGFAKAEQLTLEAENLKNWLRKGLHASMDYMTRNFEKRVNVKEILPDAKSVLSFAMNYYTENNHTNDESFGKISRYAWGKDYHLIMWDRLETLEAQLKEIDPDFKSISYVDTGPVMDKAWAVKAGIGWLGKNSNVITREIGSWIFLATMITTHQFESSTIIPDHCGSCRACIDACPTTAIVDEYIVDSNKCISFLTIENKNEIGNQFKGKFDNWLFGCDICQDICPWNKKCFTITNEREFEPAIGTSLPLNVIMEMSQTEFNNRFETSPIKRTKLSGLQRNAEFLFSNESNH
jgi:epoxyqueuosine reductase